MFKRIAKGMAPICASAGRAAPTLLRDLSGLAAVGSISFGAWQIYHPAGFIVGGILVLVAVIVAARN